MRAAQYGLDDTASVYSSFTTATSQRPGPTESSVSTHSLSNNNLNHSHHQQHHPNQHEHNHQHGHPNGQAGAVRELDDDLDGILDDLKLGGGVVEHACR